MRFVELLTYLLLDLEEMPFLEKCQHREGVCAAASALNGRGFVLEKT